MPSIAKSFRNTLPVGKLQSPSASTVQRWVRALGERGLLAAVAGVCVARVDGEPVADAAQEWLLAERSGDVVALLAPWFERMEQRLGISRWATPPNANNDVLRRGCDALGLHWEVIPRNVRVAEATLDGISVGEYEAMSAGAVAYEALAQEVMERGA